MASIEESIEIGATPDRVWAVVHEDLENAPKWSSNLVEATSLSKGPLRKGTRFLYRIKTPGGVQELELEHTTVRRAKTCAGRFVRGPLKGDWKYSYSPSEAGTRLTYTMDYGPGGLAVRIFFGVIERQLPADVRKTMRSLKRYVEAGRGPQR